MLASVETMMALLQTVMVHAQVSRISNIGIFLLGPNFKRKTVSSLRIGFWAQFLKCRLP